VSGDDAELILLNEANQCVTRQAEARSIPSDRLEDIPEAARRGGDDPQDIGGGGLLLPRLVAPGNSYGVLISQGNHLGCERCFALAQRSKLRLKLRDPRVAIVRHHLTLAALPRCATAPG